MLCLLTAGTAAAAAAAESASSASMAAKARPPWLPILLSTRCLLLPTGILAGPLFREDRPVLLDVLAFLLLCLSLSPRSSLDCLHGVVLHSPLPRPRYFKLCCLYSGPTTLLAPGSPHLLPLRDILLILMTREISI